MLRQDHHRRSKLQERRAAKDFGGSVTPGSGNGWVKKADVRTDTLLIECKTTTKESYILKGDTWDKISREALIDSRIPVLKLDLNGRSLLVVDENDYLAGS